MTRLQYAKKYAKVLEATGLLSVEVMEDLHGKGPAVLINSNSARDFTGLDILTRDGWKQLDIDTSEWFPEKENAEVIRFYK